MTKINLLILIAFIIALCRAEEKEMHKIYDTKSNKEINLNELASELSNYDVIFFGESHNSAVLHRLEIKLIREFYKENKNLIISAEMFERDTQLFIDQYINGEIKEDEFLQNSRPWSNYSTDYRPIVEFCKDNKLQFIAANVPRRYAKLINLQGEDAAENLPENEQKFIASQIKALDNEYKKRFFATMSSNMMHGGKMPMKMNLDNLYSAQCVKDDTMAESIAKEAGKNKKIIHINGKFHSDAHLGTANKLHLLKPGLKIAVITAFEIENRDFELTEKQRKDGDFVILFN
ncbi:MAG: ABC transporter permease [Candidatus Cloacimonadota bacterium]|nr:MAG: ABC transporter permease [Candidatus Cloacimonadota bacterium]